MLQTFKLEADMEVVRGNVIGLNSLWNNRTEDRPFHTLGASAYLDIRRGDTDSYFTGVQACNGALAYCFGSLYQEISKVLTDHLKMEVSFDPSLALPGFHIFFGHEAFVREGGLWHMDMGHIQLGLPDVDPISFTVTVCLPKDGGGLNYKQDDKEHYLAYEVGGMVVHDGCMMHKIASLNSYQEDDERITMQGHGVNINGEYVLFW